MTYHIALTHTHIHAFHWGHLFYCYFLLSLNEHDHALRAPWKYFQNPWLARVRGRAFEDRGMDPVNRHSPVSRCLILAFVATRRIGLRFSTGSPLISQMVPQNSLPLLSFSLLQLSLSVDRFLLLRISLLLLCFISPTIELELFNLFFFLSLQPILHRLTFVLFLYFFFFLLFLFFFFLSLLLLLFLS